MSTADKVAPPAPKPPESEVTLALAAADRTFKSRRYAEALPEYRAVAEAARAAGDTSSEAEALAQVARMCSLTERLDEGREWLAKAQAVADEAQPWGWTRYLGVRGIFERESGQREVALATFSESCAYAEERGLHVRAIDAAHHAAIVASPAEQLTWAERGIRAAERGDERGWLAVLWNNLGSSHEDRGDWPAAAKAYRQARNYHYETGGPLQKFAADWALGRSSLRAGDLASAEELLPRCLAGARAGVEGVAEAEQREWLGFSLCAHGELLLARGEAEAGRAQLREGRELLVAAKISDWWPAYLADLDARLAD